jgi:hypothetical protein
MLSNNYLSPENVGERSFSEERREGQRLDFWPKY